MTYVISDIHGEYDKFIKMLELIEFSDKDVMFILGDVVDRGRYSIKTLTHIMDSTNIHMILGNHEEFMLDYFNRNKNIPTQSMIIDQHHYETWFRAGGLETCRDLRNYRKRFDEILEYLRQLPLTCTLSVGENKFHLSHADLQISNYEVLQNQNRDYILWNRRYPQEFVFLKDNVYMITGHTPTSHLNFDKSYDIYKKDSWICIDGGAVFGGKLSCLRLDDMKEYYT